MIFNKLYSEVLEEFVNAETRQDKIDILRKYDHPRLRLMFVYLYSDKVKFDVEIPKYRPAQEPVGLNWTYLHNELAKLTRFSTMSDLPAKKKTELLVVILESLHKDEAKLLEGLLKKDLGIKYLTPKIVQEAYPDLEW